MERVVGYAGLDAGAEGTDGDGGSEGQDGRLRVGMGLGLQGFTAFLIAGGWICSRLGKQHI